MALCVVALCCAVLSPLAGSGARVKRLESGLTRLNEAATAVDRMTLELKEKKIIVDSKTKDVETLIKDIADRQRIVDVQNEEAQKKQVRALASAR